MKMFYTQEEQSGGQEVSGHTAHAREPAPAPGPLPRERKQGNNTISSHTDNTISSYSRTRTRRGNV